MSKRVLGRGLGALLPSRDMPTIDSFVQAGEGERVDSIGLDRIDPNP